VKVGYSRRALAQLDDIYDYIAADDLAVAAAVIRRIESIVFLIGRFPAMGRPTGLADIRAMSARPYPYVIFYKVMSERDEIRILRVRHMARGS